MFFLACGDNREGPPDAQLGPPCDDGIDNDGDGLVDFPDDPGCYNRVDDSEDSAPRPACDDGRDNDGDGLKDFPNDPGCLIPQQGDEADDCPDGPGCPQCGNGADDDGNGKVDFPEDPGCESAADTSELISNPVACGTGLMIKQLPATGMDTGTLDATSLSTLSSPCGGGGGSPGIAYIMLLTQPQVVVISTAGSTADTVIDLRSSNCDEPSAHLACNDDVNVDDITSSLTRSLAPGVYYIVIEGHDATALGDYTLLVQRFAGEGSDCTMQSDCGPGLVCRPPNGGGAGMKCQKPMCSDAFDNDGDGKIDYPVEPGCTGLTDNDETDDCPNGPNCPECGDTEDNDGDGQSDYPNDVSCHAAGDVSESCTTSEGIELITQPMTPGTTAGAVDDHDPTCNSTTGLAPDRLYRLVLPKVSSLNLDLVNLSFDSVTTLLDGTCGGGPIECSDASAMNVANLAAGTYYFSVDGFFTNNVGTYTIATSGTVAPGGSCEGALYLSGALTCEPGFVCDGAVGAKTCRTQCTDGIDNNGDGKIDYPLDPGCAAPNDNTETTVCPGAMCPACADLADNDLDGQTDYPLDTSCPAAGATSESCTTTEAIAIVTSGTTNGTTVGATNDYTPVCGSSGHTAPDVLLQLDLPQMQSLNLDLSVGFDSAHALLGSSCTGAPLACNDGTDMPLSGLSAGRYYLVVDGWSGGSGAFTLTTSGVIAPGGGCENALFTAGAITCPTGLTCQGAVGSKTCRSQCSDGIDNNGDGKIDFPADPSCTSLADDSEVTVCPGVNCPVCSNTTDDDADATIDFPADFGCPSAAGTSETFCAVEPNYAGAITTPSVMGTLASPIADNYDQSCQGTTGNDVAYSLVLPVPVASLQIDTFGSTVTDTVISLKDANCGAELGCDDDGDPNGNLSLMVLSNVPRGNYAIQMDSYNTGNNGPYKLNVKGTVAPQTTCTSPLFASGVLVCPAGTSCTGGKCQ